MRRLDGIIHQIIAVTFLNGLFSGFAWAQEAFPHAPPYEAFMTAPTTFPGKPAKIDDYVIEVAKATEISALVDVTDIPADTVVQPYPGTPAAKAGIAEGEKLWEPIRVNVLADFAMQYSPCLFRYEPRTFLFWKEPDLVSLTRLALADYGRRRASVAITPAAEGAAKAALIDLFKAQGWDEKSTTVDIRLKVSDLPADIQKLVHAQSLRIVFGELDPRRHFTDEFWDHATLGLHTVPAVGKQPMLQYLVLNDVVTLDPKSKVAQKVMYEFALVNTRKGR